MANSYSTSDVIKGALQCVGEQTNGTSPIHALALKYVNRAYSDVLKGASLFAPEVRECWSWARQTGSFLLPANVATTATVTNGSINGTFASAPAASLAGYNFVVRNASSSQFKSYYKIATHTAGATAFTIDFAFVETSGTYSVNCIPLTVDLGRGILRLADPLRQYNSRVLEFGESAQDMGRLYYVDINKFWEMWPLELLINDIPSRFTIQTTSDTSHVLRFNKYVSSPIRIDYDYISTQPLLTDSTASVPLVPFEDRDVLETGAAYYLFRDAKKQPTDAASFFQLTALKIGAMKMANQGQQKLGKMFGQLVPRMDDTAIPFWLIQQS